VKHDFLESQILSSNIETKIKVKPLKLANQESPNLNTNTLLTIPMKSYIKHVNEKKISNKKEIQIVQINLKNCPNYQT